MSAAIRIDLGSTAEVVPGNALKVDKAGLVLAVFNLGADHQSVDGVIANWVGACTAK